MIQICNLRHEKPSKQFDIIVDRTHILGCPFRLKSEADREAVIFRYELWLNSEITKGNQRVLDELNYLSELYTAHGELRLFCWCAPKQCHAEKIRDAIYSIRGD